MIQKSQLLLRKQWKRIIVGQDFEIHNRYIDDTKITAIAGRNGSGKTTLTRLLMGLVHPNRGSMTLDDIDITKKEPYEMAQYLDLILG